MDNLKQLKEVILELFSHKYNPTEVKRKLRDLEFDMKKYLFFSNNQDRDQINAEKEEEKRQIE